ncbi:MAG TPA: zinc ribbon domain-containing protein [Clostridia bacterium]|nr:zinc ribbon domain-containing protein [Clostridia bacterium]
MSRFCKNCGGQLKPTAAFCGNCGAHHREAQRTYRRPVAFRVIACFLILVLTVSAGWRLTWQPGGESPSVRADSNPDPLSLGISYTADEILASPAKSGPVSSESPVIELGDVVVDFDPWNLSDEDEFVVRTLPEKTDTAGGTSILGYDLSLSSGQNTFFTPVTVTIPRTTGEDEDGSVVLYHEAGGEWSYVSSELSEDGMSYVASIPHFSVAGEKKVKKYVGTETDIRSTAGDLTTQGSLYQYMSFTALDGSFIPMVQRSIYMSDSSFRKLFSSVQTDELRRLLLLAELPSQDAIAFSLGTLNDAQSLADAALLASRVDAALSAAGKIRLDGCMAGFGAILTVGRIAYQANKGGNFAAILMENKYNILEGILGGMAYGASYIGAAAASSVFSVAAVAVFAWSLATGFYEGVSKYESYQEHGYRFFMDQKKPRFSEYTLRVGLEGDFELGINGENFARALKYIYDAYAGKPKELDEAVNRFYTEYANLFWTALTHEDREAHYNNEYMSTVLRQKWEPPSQESIDRYTGKVIARAVSESEPILRSFARGALADMQSQLYNIMKREVEPYLNSKLTFVVKDSSLKEGQTFDTSPYWKHEITFSNRTQPLFAPRFVDISAYTDDKYAPKPHKDSNVVYECTMYHYLQMGCPTQMVFKGDPEGGLAEITVDFNVDEGEVALEISGSQADGKGFAAFSSKHPVERTRSKSAEYVLVQMAMRSAETININLIGEEKYRFVIPAYEYRGDDDDVFTSDEMVFEGKFNSEGYGEFNLVSGGNIMHTYNAMVIEDGKERWYPAGWWTENTQCVVHFYPLGTYPGGYIDSPYSNQKDPIMRWNLDYYHRSDEINDPCENELTRSVAQLDERIIIKGVGQ